MSSCFLGTCGGEHRVVTRGPEQLVRDVGRRVAELRREACLTQEQLAERLGVSPRWVRRLEQQGENATIHTLARVANAIGVEVAVLLEEPSDEARVVRPGRPPKG